MTKAMTPVAAWIIPTIKAHNASRASRVIFDSGVDGGALRAAGAGAAGIGMTANEGGTICRR
jgi:hypothetical protein